MALVSAGLWTSLASGSLTLAVGLVHVGRQVGQWCDAEATTCVGPALVWNGQGADFTDDSNVAWRTVFTLVPDLFFFNWSPVLFGWMTLAIHVSPDVRWNAICANWGRVCLWSVFVALFCNFGYAGQFGILVGLLTSFNALLAAMIEIQYEGAPTCLGIQIRALQGYDAQGLGAVAAFALLAAAAAALLTFSTGVVAVLDRLPNPCDSAIRDCFGPGLFWAVGDSGFADDINGVGMGRWGGFFTLAPTAFIGTFTPLVMGAISVAIQLSASRFFALTASWTRVCLWHLTMGLLVAGYAGNLGVVAMFVCSFVSLLAFVLSLAHSPPLSTRAGVDLAGAVGALGSRRVYQSQRGAGDSSWIRHNGGAGANPPPPPQHEDSKATTWFAS